MSFIELPEARPFEYLNKKYCFYFHKLPSVSLFNCCLINTIIGTGVRHLVIFQINELVDKCLND